MPKIPVSLSIALALLAGALVGAALLQPRSVAAVDGQVNINQATVMAAGGYPYRISQPGSYKLSGNLIVPAGGNGIFILADNVTLDLNGFSIMGQNRCTGQPVTSCTGGDGQVGVFATNNDITVKNGSVVGIEGVAVYLLGYGELVEDVHTSQSSTGIQTRQGIVRRCTANSNGGDGIQMFSGGVLESNAVAFNGLDGMQANGGTVIGNDSSHNKQYGLLATQGPALVGSNRLSGNSPDLQIASGAISQMNNNCSGASC